MAIHWTIAFKSLRTGTDYRVNIYDANYSGSSSIQLKGAAEPFTTEEDDDEDMFTPLRLQSGYIRIVDDGKDANGNTFDWRTLIPANDKSRPVTLTKTVGSQQQIVWQGFMQAQNYSGELYSYAQEREFPIQCCLSVLSTTQVPTTETQPRNFAYLLKTCLDAIPQHTIENIVVQGGSDAQGWLLKLVDWRVFLEIDDNDEYAAKYNLQEALEDMCRFWGWTARTKGTTLYLTMADDSSETTFLSMTRAQLNTMAGGTAAGGTSAFASAPISGDVFASDDNEDNYIRGYNKCVVKSSIESEDAMIKFAPESVRKLMEQNGYVWHHLPNDAPEGVGYYTTQKITSFTSSTLDGTTYGLAGFYRRQIYSKVEDVLYRICCPLPLFLVVLLREKRRAVRVLHIRIHLVAVEQRACRKHMHVCTHSQGHTLGRPSVILADVLHLKREKLCHFTEFSVEPLDNFLKRRTFEHKFLVGGIDAVVLGDKRERTIEFEHLGIVICYKKTRLQLHISYIFLCEFRSERFYLLLEYVRSTYCFVHISPEVEIV